MRRLHYIKKDEKWYRTQFAKKYIFLLITRSKQVFTFYFLTSLMIKDLTMFLLLWHVCQTSKIWMCFNPLVVQSRGVSVCVSVNTVFPGGFILERVCLDSVWYGVCTCATANARGLDTNSRLHRTLTCAHTHTHTQMSHWVDFRLKNLEAQWGHDIVPEQSWVC